MEWRRVRNRTDTLKIDLKKYLNGKNTLLRAFQEFLWKPAPKKMGGRLGDRDVTDRGEWRVVKLTTKASLLCFRPFPVGHRRGRPGGFLEPLEAGT